MKLCELIPSIYAKNDQRPKNDQETYLSILLKFLTLPMTPYPAKKWSFDRY
jgi:hypothetical protein